MIPIVKNLALNALMKEFHLRSLTIDWSPNTVAPKYYSFRTTRIGVMEGAEYSAPLLRWTTKENKRYIGAVIPKLKEGRYSSKIDEWKFLDQLRGLIGQTTINKEKG